MSDLSKGLRALVLGAALLLHARPAAGQTDETRRREEELEGKIRELTPLVRAASEAADRAD